MAAVPAPAVHSHCTPKKGTFFHYFPTKLDVLVAVLETGVADLREAFDAIEQRTSGLSAIEEYADQAGAEMANPAFATFVGGLSSVERDPRVAEVLANEAAIIDDFVRRHVSAGRDTGEIRTDVPAAELSTWIRWIVDGAAAGAATTGAAPDTSVVSAIRAVAVSDRGARAAP